MGLVEKMEYLYLVGRMILIGLILFPFSPYWAIELATTVAAHLFKLLRRD